MSPMRTLEPPNRLRLGLLGVIIVVLATAVGQSFSSAPMLFAKPFYYGQFTDTGQINKGDKVRMAGKNVGEVEALSIDGDHVRIRFNTGTNPIGDESRLAIKTDTILGKKVLEVETAGSRPLRPGAALPLGRSTLPYQLYEAIFDTTRAASSWGIDTVKESLSVLSLTIEQTSPHLSAALDGVAKFADTIGKRDEQVKHLLAQANQVASVLGDRSEQIDRLLVNAKTLLAAFNQRGQAIDALLANAAAASAQVQGLINDNPNLTHVLEQLRSVSDLLLARKDDVADALVENGKFIKILNETIASGPYFKVQNANFLPTNYQFMQPWLDAAFKKRGIEPQEFWRNAGLPVFRYPDPNGVRLPNGAPPPAPQLLEGTPEHPGPAVPPGGPCSYAPAAGDFPTPTNLLPCLGGTFGPWGGSYPLSGFDVLTSPPNPNGLPASPGIGMGGRPGDVAPDVPGTPVPLPPDAPHGARTEPIGPPGPAEGNPGHAPPPPVRGPYPPAPAGPGNQLPVPFIPPGEGGNSQPGGGGGALEGR